MNNPLVSVIMPAYNAEKYIAGAIQSVLDQDYSNFELLIINDGSTDNTRQIIQSFGDGRIRYFEQNNQGVSAARNVGLDNMKGEYFCFLDADDKYTKISLSRRVSVFKKKGHIDFLDGCVVFKNRDFSKTIRKWCPSFKGEPLSDLIRFTGKSFFGPSWMIRSSRLGKCRFETDLSHVEDLYFYISLSLNGGNYDFIYQNVLVHRVHTESAINNHKSLIANFGKVEKKLFNNNSIPLKDKLRYSLKYRKISTILKLKSFMNKL